MGADILNFRHTRSFSLYDDKVRQHPNQKDVCAHVKLEKKVFSSLYIENTIIFRLGIFSTANWDDSGNDWERRRSPELFYEGKKRCTQINFTSKCQSFWV